MKKFLLDAKQRYLNSGTLGGIAILILTTVFLLNPLFLQTVIIGTGYIAGLYFLFSNPIKKEYNKWKMVAEQDKDNVMNFNKPSQNEPPVT